ncbi:GxxExxY protein [Hymenobacter aquaticus]|uniref:GxxExxY protein n=1 Tax=Hymenobacter aquaticus TaxID=1867101 RepID=A0A4Z0Q5J9_9BACT|nr:GxxExxY protein [Hymenobacter aquaticus]TGE25378.1 GxxExxY protein [Hymenobacter aquaticus]
MTQSYKFQELTHTIIGCAMRVHSTLGSGFPEVIYQRSLAQELSKAGVAFQREVSLPIYYEQEIVGHRRVDFLAAEQVLVELKATSELTNIHFNQILNYLTAYRLEIGLLINFGEPSLRFRRFIKTKRQP